MSRRISMVRSIARGAGRVAGPAALGEPDGDAARARQHQRVGRLGRTARVSTAGEPSGGGSPRAPHAAAAPRATAGSPTSWCALGRRCLRWRRAACRPGRLRGSAGAGRCRRSNRSQPHAANQREHPAEDAVTMSVVIGCSSRRPKSAAPIHAPINEAAHATSGVSSQPADPDEGASQLHVTVAAPRSR